MTPDAVLPARDALLDATYMRGRLARLLMGTSSPTSLPVERVTVMRVKYRPGESLRVLYRLRLEGQGHLVSSRMRPGGLDALYAEAQQHEVPSASGEPGRESQPSASLRGVAIDRDLSAVFWTFPNDRCLRGTADWAALRAACAGPVNPATARFEVAGYAPERAVVFRVGDDDPARPRPDRAGRRGDGGLLPDSSCRATRAGAAGAR